MTVHQGAGGVATRKRRSTLAVMWLFWSLAAACLPLAGSGCFVEEQRPVVPPAAVDGQVSGEGLDVEPPPSGEPLRDESAAEEDPALGRLRGMKVDVAELEAGASIGLGARHLSEEGEIRDEVYELLKELPEIVSLYFFRADVSDGAFEQARAFKGLTEFSASSSSMYGAYTDAGVAHLAELPKLEELNLFSATNVTDAGMSSIAGLVELRALCVTDARFTDAGLAKLASLKQLTKLELINCAHFEGHGLAFLNELPALRELSLWGCDCTGEGLSVVRGLPELESLSMDYNERLAGPGVSFLLQSPDLRVLTAQNCPQLGDAILAAARNCHELECLWVDCTGVTDAGLEHLGALESLEDLGLRGNLMVGDAGLASLANLHELTDLNLSGCAKITDAGIQPLAGLAKLRNLNLDYCSQLTDDTLSVLGHLGNLRGLSLCETQVTDAGLRHLAGLEMLQSVDLSDTPVTPAGIEMLKKSLPEATVHQD